MSISSYSDFKQLEGAFRTMWGEVCKEHPGNAKGKSAGTYKTEAKRCASLYANAVSSNRSFVVLGESSIRQDESLMANLGTISTNPVFSKSRAKTYLQERLPSLGPKIKQVVDLHLTQGAVLNEGNWFILPNDMVMLGVIHSGKECHLATSDGAIPEEEVLWDKENSRPRVLGRELLQVYLGGFRVVKESLLSGKGIVLLQVDEKKSKETQLIEIRQGPKMATFETIQQIFKDTVPYAETVKGKLESQQQ